MVILPAAGVGLAVVFFAGFLVMYLALDVIGKTSFRELSGWREFLTERHKERLSLIGGALAVVLLVLILLYKPRWQPAIWIALIALGILFGILSFIIHSPGSSAQPRVKHRPPPAAQTPPARQSAYPPARPCRLRRMPM